MTALHERSAGELLAAFGEGSTTPTEALEACLAHIEAREPAAGALPTVCGDRARRAAAESTARWRAGTARPLEGVPYGVKDIVATAGVLTTGGSAIFADHVPERSASAVRRIEDAGAVLVAKTATPEWAFGDAREGHRATNPWDPTRWTGGSSAGSAVALAARELPLAVGTDTGGSIRVPASYCGVTGLKPTAGRVPRDGVMGVSWTLDHVGPMARDVDDVARLLAVMAGHDPADPGSSRHPVDDLDPLGDDVTGLRVGVPRAWCFDECDAAVEHATRAALDVLRDLGATIVDVSLPNLPLAGIAAWVITVAEFAAMHEPHLDRLDEFTPAAAERIAAGAALGAPDYLRALRARTVVQHDFEEAFARVDVIVSPATPTAAPRIVAPLDPMFADGDRAWLERIARNFLVHNLTGMPALVLPVGTDGVLPVGMQVAAPPWGEARCLQVGAAFQRATDHHRRAPSGSGG